jgi:hypothetical protein
MSFPASSYVGAVAAGPGEGFKNWTAAFASIATTSAVVVGGIWAYFKFVRGRTFHPRLSVEILGQWRNVDTGHPEAYVFHFRVCATNIGAAKVTLKQYGTGLRLAFPSEQQPSPPYSFAWEYVAVRKESNKFREFEVIEILKDVQWIEPGETASDDLLLDLGRSPTNVLLELTLQWSRSRMRFRKMCRRIYRSKTRRRISRWSLRRRMRRQKLYRCGLRRRLHRWIYRRVIDDYSRRDVVDYARRIVPPDSVMIDKV